VSEADFARLEPGSTFEIVRWFGVYVLLHKPLMRVQKARAMCVCIVTWMNVKVRRAFSINGSPAVGD
jgi:hypothetical protein